MAVKCRVARVMTVTLSDDIGVAAVVFGGGADIDIDWVGDRVPDFRSRLNRGSSTRVCVCEKDEVSEPGTKTLEAGNQCTVEETAILSMKSGRASPTNINRPDDIRWVAFTATMP